MAGVYPSYGLSQEQTQKLVMTQGLKQAIAMLHMSAADLWSYVAQSVESNPVLEWAVSFNETASAVDWATGGDDFDAIDARSAAVKSHEDVRHMPRGRKNHGLGKSADAAERAVATNDGLRAELRSQLGLERLEPSVRTAVAYLIECVDDRGYLACSLEEAAADLKVSPGEARVALTVLQSFEPVGVGARDLGECLALQLRESASSSAAKLAQLIVSEHLESLAAGREDEIARVLSCSRREVAAAIALIRTLDPRPGWRFGSPTIEYAIPDVEIITVGQSILVIPNDEVYPHVRIASPYAAGLRSLPRDARDYVAPYFSAASEFVRALETRQRTVVRVAEAIARRQREFFAIGAEALKPLTLRGIADELELHESTVSRAVAGKYALTARGVFELRYFFSAGLHTADGEGMAAEGVRALIRRLIEDENRQHPLSDQELADRLASGGVRVSRRTVAKYREEMRIAASAVRKRLSSPSR